MAMGSMGPEETGEQWTGADAGWTGTSTLADKEYTASISRPLSAKPALTEGDDAFQAVFFSSSYADESKQVFTKFEPTVVGGAAALAAGATLAASLLF